MRRKKRARNLIGTTRKFTDIREVPLKWYVEKLKYKDHFAFVRYGDAEWRALLQGYGTGGSRLQLIDKKIQAEMIRDLVAYARIPQVIFGLQYFARRLFKENIGEFLRNHGLSRVSWVDADVFHYASRDGLLYPLIEQLRKMKIVVVGPNFLRRIKENVFDYYAFVEVPPKNSYSEKNDIKSRILDIHQKAEENVVYSFCCGPLAETLILELQEKMPKNFLIDFGSLWDVFCGQRSRGYTKSKSFTNRILRKNLGVKMTIGNVLPHLGAFGGVRRFLELGNVFKSRGIDYTIFVKEGHECEWFNFRGKIRDWSKIKADCVIIGDTPSLRVIPRVQGKVFVYVIVGGDYGKGYQNVYGKYPFILDNRVFRRQFPKAYLAEGGVNTHFFRPPEKKREVSDRVRVLYYASKRKFKGREHIKASLSGIDGIELIGLSGLNNKQLLAAYHNADFLVTWESRPGWNNMASEAIASGLTVVTNGVNCEPFIDKVIKVNNLRKFFSHPENRKIRKPGSMEEFSWEKVADRLLQIFEHYSHKRF